MSDQTKMEPVSHTVSYEDHGCQCGLLSHPNITAVSSASLSPVCVCVCVCVRERERKRERERERETETDRERERQRLRPGLVHSPAGPSGDRRLCLCLGTSVQ
jgi:hypothetical protein